MENTEKIKQYMNIVTHYLAKIDIEISKLDLSSKEDSLNKETVNAD